MGDEDKQALRGILELLQEINKTLPGLGSNIKSTRNITKQHTKAMDDWYAASKELAAIGDKTSTAYKNQEKAVNNLKADVDLSTKALNHMGIAVDGVGGKLDKNTSKIAKFGSGWTQATRAIQQVHTTVTAFNQTMGIQSLTFTNAYKSVLAYNTSMYSLTKSQRLFGERGNDTRAALDTFSQGTTLGIVKSLEFTNSFNQMYKGIQPTSQAIADFAVMIQESFGPSVEKTMEVQKVLLGLQNKFPPILESLQKAHSAFKNNMVSDGKEISSGNAAVLLAMGASAEEMKAAFQFEQVNTPEEEAMLELLKKQQTAVKESENANLTLGKTSEETFKTMADMLSKTYSLFAKNAWIAGTFAGSILAINVAQSLAIGSVGKLITQMIKAKALQAGLQAGTGAVVQAGTGAAVQAGTGAVVQAGTGAAVQAGTGAVAGAGTAAVAGAGTAAAGTAGMGALAAGGLIVAAGALGAGFGMLLDKIFGISDAIGSKDWGKPSESEATADAKEYNEKTTILLKGRMGKEGFESAAKERGLDSVKDEQERQKILKEITQEVIKKGFAEKESLNAVQKQSLEYRNLEATLNFQQQMQDKVTQSIEAHISLAREYNAVTEDMLQKKLASEMKSLEFSKQELDAAVNLVKLMEADVKGGIDFKGMDVEQMQEALQKKLNDINLQIPILEANKDNKGINQDKNKEELEKALKDQEDYQAKSDLLSQKFGKVETGKKTTFTSETGMKKELVSIEQKHIAALQKKYTTQAELYKQMHMGVGPSLQMTNKLIEMEDRTIANTKKITVDRRKELEGVHEISEAKMEAILNAEGQEERERAIADAIGTANLQSLTSEELAAKLNGFQLDYLEALDQEMGAKVKINEMTKGLREGYLDALVSQRINVGEFGKILGSQDKAQGQILQTIKEATGEAKGNTLGMGGILDSVEQGAAAGKMNVMGEQTSEGFRLGRTNEQYEKEPSLLYDPFKGLTLDEKIGKLKAGTESISQENLDVAVKNGWVAPGEVDQIKTYMDASKKTELSKRNVPTQALQENRNPESVQAFGKAVQAAASAQNQVPKQVETYKDMERKTEQQRERMGVTPEGTTTAALGNSAGAIGTIYVAVDEEGGLKVRLVQFGSDIVQLKAATGMETAGTPAIPKR